jgi:hypothetical protein
MGSMLPYIAYMDPMGYIIRKTAGGFTPERLVGSWSQIWLNIKKTWNIVKPRG